MLLAGEMLIMLIMLNPLPEFPKSPKYELTLLTLLTFPLPEAFFFEGGIDIINIPSVLVKNVGWRMPENPIKIGFLIVYGVKRMLIPGAVPFSDLRSQKKTRISVHKIVSRKMALLLGRIRGGERFGSKKGR